MNDYILILVLILLLIIIYFTDYKEEFEINTYVFNQGYNSNDNLPYGDLSIYANNIERLSNECNKLSNCVGFTNNGILKNGNSIFKDPLLTLPYDGIYINKDYNCDPKDMLLELSQSTIQAAQPTTQTSTQSTIQAVQPTTQSSTQSTTQTIEPTTQAIEPTTKTPMLYEFKSHMFTTANKSGSTGPTLEEIKNAYSDVDWTKNNEFLNMTKQGIQEWKVPVTGNYKIRAVGAAGGNPGLFGRGRDVSLVTTLTKGEIIKILVGQKGAAAANAVYSNGGGGGGTFVVRDISTPIIVAGGGGGSAFNHSNHSSGLNSLISNAVLTTSGSDGSDNSGSGGINGNGGGIPGASNTAFAGGGGGLLGSGMDANASKAKGGLSFLLGGTGGDAPGNSWPAVGGFGGGGGSLLAQNGGGGGGYSGGGAGGYNIKCKEGGGGGSYGLTTLTDNGAINNGDGSVLITLIDTNVNINTQTTAEKAKQTDETADIKANAVNEAVESIELAESALRQALALESLETFTNYYYI